MLSNKVPGDWKKGNISPFFKKGRKEELQASSVPGKIMEQGIACTDRNKGSLRKDTSLELERSFTKPDMPLCLGFGFTSHARAISPVLWKRLGMHPDFPKSEQTVLKSTTTTTTKNPQAHDCLKHSFQTSACAYRDHLPQE